MSYVDFLVGVVLLFVVAIVAITTIMIFEQLEENPKFNDSLPPQGYQAFNTIRQSQYVWDYAGVFFLFAVIGVTALSASLINSQPGLFAIGVLFMLVFLAVSTVFYTMYSQLMANPYFSSIANNFTWTLTALQWLPLIGLLAMAVIAVATHGKTRL